MGEIPDNPGVYKIIGGKEVVYVGQTNSLKNRESQHVLTNDPDFHFEYILIENSQSRKEVEKELIEKFQPRFNKNWNSDSHPNYEEFEATESKPMKCPKCGKRWNYKGTKDKYASCPDCKTSVKIDENRVNDSDLSSQSDTAARGETQ